MMNDYFDFIMYLAFRAILIYENKRSLTLEQLHNYRKTLYKKHLEYHSKFTEYDDKDFEENILFFHSSNANMTINEEQKKFLQFIKENNELFSYKNGVITLKDEVDYEYLNESSFELDSYTNDKYSPLICGELLNFFDCIECLDLLDAKKIKNFAKSIISDEKKIEEAYHAYNEVELEKNIKKTSESVNYRLALIGNLSDDKMNCYQRMFSNYGHIDVDAKGDDFWLLSECLMENDKFYKLNEKYIDFIMQNKFQRAIFDKGTLVYDRLNDIMNAFWSYRKPDAVFEVEPFDAEAMSLWMEEREQQAEAYEDEYEDENEIDFDEYEEDDMNQVDLYLHEKNINFAFYLNYIVHVDDFLRKHGSDEVLEFSKNRLLYLLDGYGDDLYKKSKFKNVLNNTSVDDIDYIDALDDFYKISRLFLVDILNGWIDDDMTLRKLLFISTYYDLTNDNRIKKIINKYKKDEIGKKISTIIFEKDLDMLNSEFYNSTKKLIKKKNNNNKYE